MTPTIGRSSRAPALLPALAPRRYHRRRRGTPDPDAAWQRLRAATAAVRPLTQSAREFEVDDTRDLPQDVSTVLPKLQIKTSLPLPTYGPVPFGPVLLSVAPRITLKGSASLGRPQTTVAVTPGQAKAEFETAVATSFGKISVTGAVEPGKPSKVGIKVGTEIVDVEFAAQVSLTEPVVVTVKPKLPVQRTVTFGDWTFEGTVEVNITIPIAPNPTWPGWAHVARGTVAATRGIVAVARGLFFAGEVGAATALGAVALGTTLAAGGIAWVGLSLYLIGRANLDARTLKMGYEFCNGYGEMLANLTSGQRVVPDTAAGQRIYWDWITTDWRGDYEEQRVLWMEKEDKDALFRIRLAGRMAAVQDMELFFRLYGPQRWRDVVARHKAQYGQADGIRKQAYLRTLYAQMKAGKPIGLPLAPPP